MFLSRSEEISREHLEGLTRRSHPSHPALAKGAHVYVAYSGERPLYVGETGHYVRTRFKEDGGGSHDRSEWYGRMSHVRFLRLPCAADDKYYRQLVEAALVVKLGPSEM